MSTAYRFLVVDDDEQHRHDMARTLFMQFPGAVVRQCVAGPAAVACLDGGHDAVLVHQMSGAEGLAVTRLLRNSDAVVPLLFISAENYAKDAAAAGATRYLTRAQSSLVGTIVVNLLATQPKPAPQ